MNPYKMSEFKPIFERKIVVVKISNRRLLNVSEKNYLCNYKIYLGRRDWILAGPEFLC